MPVLISYNEQHCDTSNGGKTCRLLRDLCSRYILRRDSYTLDVRIEKCPSPFIHHPQRCCLLYPFCFWAVASSKRLLWEQLPSWLAMALHRYCLMMPTPPSTAVSGLI